MKMRIITAALFMTLLSAIADASSVYTRRVENAVSAAKASTIPVGGNQINYSLAFPIASNDDTRDIGVMYQASGTSPNIVITFEQSHQKPATEGTIDTAYLTTDVITSAVTDTNWHMATIDTVEMTYGRFRVQGLGSNGSGNTVTIKLAK